MMTLGEFRKLTADCTDATPLRVTVDVIGGGETDGWVHSATIEDAGDFHSFVFLAANADEEHPGSYMEEVPE